jgi:hypothetical protein
MYWENCRATLVLESKCNNRPVAKKNHVCCECDEEIYAGEEYSYFGGVWYDDWTYEKWFAIHKTCLRCEEIWGNILKIFQDHGESDAPRVYGLLREAIKDAYDEGYLTSNDSLVNEWLSICPEDVSPEEEETREKRLVTSQMETHSTPLL